MKAAIDLLVVDYLQLVSGSRRYENRTQKVTEISRGLKHLAKELDISGNSEKFREIPGDSGNFRESHRNSQKNRTDTEQN